MSHLPKSQKATYQKAEKSFKCEQYHKNKKTNTEKKTIDFFRALPFWSEEDMREEEEE